MYGRTVQQKVHRNSIKITVDFWRRARDFFGALPCTFASLRSLTPSAKTVHRTVFFRRLRLLPPCSNPSFVLPKQKAGLATCFSFWRRVRDSNPRDLSVYSISSAAPSTTRTTLRVYFRPVFFPEICSKIRWRENRRDGKKYSILRFSVLRNIKENQGDEIPSFCRNFESAPL